MSQMEHPNLFIAESIPVLLQVAQIITTNEPAHSFKATMKHHLKRLNKQWQKHYSPQQANTASFFIACFIDEKARDVLWANHAHWASGELGEPYVHASPNFTIALENCTRSPQNNVALLELANLMFQMGFKANLPFPEKETEFDSIQEGLHDLIIQLAEKASSPDNPRSDRPGSHPQPITETPKPQIKLKPETFKTKNPKPQKITTKNTNKTPLAWVASLILTTGIITGVYFIYYSHLNNSLKNAKQQWAQATTLHSNKGSNNEPG